ncbi:hypothetical protein A9993_12260 [Rahnella victoriana]|uniref:LuxR C-terminal-related transcriptional regulator n=1 Tax=Rahnella victoriana TaxID=1510570 RepID=UPI000BB1EB3C|nr:LuxR C-terminal-related transcriptional regulator [Rahnella victoriana]PBI80454.1 hypothetical protein A9993_12260 [Rahnella victoriana]
MLNIAVMHCNSFWKEGLTLLLRELKECNRAIRILNSDTQSIKSCDILFVSRYSLIRLPAETCLFKKVILIHKVHEAGTVEGYKYFNKIYEDDSCSELRLKIKQIINLDSKGISLNEMLTKKECLIVKGLIKGMSTYTLAKRYEMTSKGISACKRSAMRKLNVRTTQSLREAVLVVS